MSSTAIRDRETGAPLVCVTRRILAAGVHTAPGFGVAIFGPAGLTRGQLQPGMPLVYRFFLTPLKLFPMIKDAFTIPALRCHGGGITVTAPGVERPEILTHQLGELVAFAPIPWPEGSVGNPGPDYVPPKPKGLFGKKGGGA